MADFHFIRPLWFIAFAVLAFVFYLLKRLRVSSSGWQQVLPKHLADNLLGREEKAKPQSLFIPMLIGSLVIIALAGPTWQKLPQPVFNTERGSVIVMDMSNSMYATDLSPNRLTRARYKASDLLEQINEGDIGLIAYAGDAFVISPLTKDINNIELLLPALSPALMPEQGSNPFVALLMANDMLTNAGHIEGDIYWITDGVDHYDVEDINDFNAQHPHRLNILGVGTAQGAPIKMPNGQLLKDERGAIVVPPLTIKQLQGLSGGGNGTYRTISVGSSDIEALAENTHVKESEKQKEEQLAQGDQWAEAGPYVVLLILPFVLLYFRRGFIVAIIPAMLLIPPSPTYATEQQPQVTEAPTFWDSLWQTQDQQAQQKFNQEDYSGAAEQFENPLWQGSAHYKDGNYESALEAFSKSNSAEALYNQGNSLAKLNELDKAINAYEEALAKNPNLTAAQTNKELLEQLKQQQQQQDNQGEGQDQNQDQDQQNQSDDENQQSQQSNDSQSGEQNDQQQSQDQQNAGQQGEQSEEENQNKEQSSDEAGEQTKEQEENAQAEPQSESDENSEQQAKALKAEQAAKEQEQKHQQMLKKVTDDPYLLLRNKMQLEYQKRRHQNTGDKKKW